MALRLSLTCCCTSKSWLPLTASVESAETSPAPKPVILLPLMFKSPFMVAPLSKVALPSKVASPFTFSVPSKVVLPDTWRLPSTLPGLLPLVCGLLSSSSFSAPVPSFACASSMAKFIVAGTAAIALTAFQSTLFRAFQSTFCVWAAKAEAFSVNSFMLCVLSPQSTLTSSSCSSRDLIAVVFLSMPSAKFVAPFASDNEPFLSPKASAFICPTVTASLSLMPSFILTIRRPREPSLRPKDKTLSSVATLLAPKATLPAPFTMAFLPIATLLYFSTLLPVPIAMLPVPWTLLSLPIATAPVAKVFLSIVPPTIPESVYADCIALS